MQLPEKHAKKTLITAIEGLPGTDGYRPPEYGDRKFSALSDVYSYGVVSDDIMGSVNVLLITCYWIIGCVRVLLRFTAFF